MLTRKRFDVEAGMAIDLNFADQEVLADTFRRAQSRMTARERGAELLVICGFAIAVLGLWLIDAPGAFPVTPAVLCVIVMALATRVRFDTPLGFTVATQLAFVPLLFTIPAALVPIAVVIALALARLPELRAGRFVPARRSCGASETRGSRSVRRRCSRSPAPQPARAGPALLLAALAAQFLVDFAVSAIRIAVGRGAKLSSQLRETVGVRDRRRARRRSGCSIAEDDPAQRRSPRSHRCRCWGCSAVFARERHRSPARACSSSTTPTAGPRSCSATSIEADDGYTGEHCKSVVALALAVADRLGLAAGAAPQPRIRGAAARRRQDRDPQEDHQQARHARLRRMDRSIRTHTIEGQKLLDRVGGFMRDVGLIVRSHHERWDGRGYPDGLAGEAIPLEARIIACCDTWNAMRTDRSYRPALPYEAALAELVSVAGSQLDPEVVNALVAIVGSGHRDDAAAAAAAEGLRRSASNEAVPAYAQALPTPPEAAMPAARDGDARTALQTSIDQILIRRAIRSRSAEPLRTSPTGRRASRAARRASGALEDVRSGDPVERLLEESWDCPLAACRTARARSVEVGGGGAVPRAGGTARDRCAASTLSRASSA